MKTPILVPDRRALLKGAAALGALQVASPSSFPFALPKTSRWEWSIR